MIDLQLLKQPITRKRTTAEYAASKSERKRLVGKKLLFQTSDLTGPVLGCLLNDLVCDGILLLGDLADQRGQISDRSADVALAEESGEDLAWF